VSNVFVNLYFIIRGPEKLKQEINESKLKRAEKEALERAEEEERKLKKKKEEEEFTKLHDETSNLSRMDDTQGGTTLVGNNTTQGEFLGGKGKKRTKAGKGKDTDANVVDGGIGGVDSTDFGPKSKHRKRNDKEKGAKGDDVVEA